MQSSDNGSDATVEDLCRKKFKPIAPKPFLQKDSHQSMLTTVLPVKQPQPDTKDAIARSLTDTHASSVPISSSSSSGKYGGDLPPMPVMYGGPVFIPVRFPFPVLVPAMFNVNGNQQQKCTCHASKESLNKSGQSEVVEAKLEGDPQQSCPVHYSFHSSQPTYINSPLPNVQSSFMPMYMSSGSSMVNKGEWSAKPKYNRYKYSMLKNGDIYKGMASSFPSYSDWNQSINCSQSPGDFIPYTSQKDQYLTEKLHTESASQAETDNDRRKPCCDSPCSVSCTVPSKCDTMFQTSMQGCVGHSAHVSAEQQREPPPNKVIGVDAAVQTDNQEIKATKDVTQGMLNDATGKQTNSSNVQCTLASLPTSSLIARTACHTKASVTCGGSSTADASGSTSITGGAKSADLRLKNSAQGSAELSSSSAFTSPSNTSALITGYGSTTRNKEHTVMPSSATLVPSSGLQDRSLSSLPTISVRPHPDTRQESNENSYKGSPARRMQRTIFSSEPEVSTSSEALQQRNYETDVIVPLRAAPSPSDAHDSEDMDRFVLSPVISESDSEDIFSRQMQPAAGFFRQPQNRQDSEAIHASSPSLARTDRILSVNSIRASNLPIPPSATNTQVSTSNKWSSPLSQSMQGNDNQFHSNFYATTTSGTSVGYSVSEGNTSTLGGHRNTYTSLNSVCPYPHALPSSSSIYVACNPLSREPQTCVQQPMGNYTTEHHAYPSTSVALPGQSFTISGASRESTYFPASRTTDPLVSEVQVARRPVVNHSSSHSSGSKENGQVSDHLNSRTREERSKKSPPNSNDKENSESHERERFGTRIQSVRLQSNVASHIRGEVPVHRPLRKDATNSLLPSRGVSSEPTFGVTVGHRTGTLTGSSGGRNSELPLQSTSSPDQQRREPVNISSRPHLHSTQSFSRNVGSSSTGYPMPLVPSIACRNNVPPIPMHDSSSHPLHGFPQPPLSGTGISMHGSMSSGISPRHNHSTHPHPFQPGGSYHGQHSHMYYPHYGGLHQPLSMATSPAPSHSDLSLLSPRSCAHLHIHGNMLHSPQMSSSVHSFQRPPGFSSGLHAASYPYPALEDRLDTCCSGRIGHSPSREDRSIPTLLTNILHRRPGAFSHLERTANSDHNKSPGIGILPSQAAVVTTAVSQPTPTRSTVTVSVHSNPSTNSSPRNVVSSVSVTCTTATAMPTQNHCETMPSFSSASRSAVVTEKVSSSKSPPRNIPVVQSHAAPPNLCSLSPSPAMPLSTSSSHQNSPAPKSNQQHNSTLSTSETIALPMSSPPTPSQGTSRGLPGNNSDKYLPVEAIPPSPACSSAPIQTPENGRQHMDQVIKYGEAVLKCSRQILRESGRTVLCCWSCDYHTAEPRKMHRHQKKENQLQKCQLCDFKADTRCKVNQHYKEVHMDKDDPFRSVNV